MRKLVIVLAIALAGCSGRGVVQGVSLVDRPDTGAINSNYVSNRAPLVPQSFIKLPVGTIKAEGWLGEALERQRNGMNGRLGELSPWLVKNDNAWLNKGGNHGWEEVPYWLKGYGDLAYVLHDDKMVEEAKVWIEGALASQRADGFFGPDNRENGKPDLWPNMIMLWCLQSYYDYTGDARVLDFMTKYFRWELTVPDEDFLKEYWGSSRAGDNIESVMWLYNRTGDDTILPLIEKIHRNAQNWHQDSNLPNWHNVNIAQCFREPAQYFAYSKDSSMLYATYNNFGLIRRTFGQVPGGMWAGDENSRLGYIDPRQGIETCALVEQMNSDELLLRQTGDPFWAENCEDVAFNTYTVALTPDLKGLRYITSPNMVVSDARNHSPGIQNGGHMFLMTPVSHRCCQHDHGQGWPYLAENLIYATPDDGIAAVLYSACSAKVKVSGGVEVGIHETTNYPFDEKITFSIDPESSVSFPLYLRIPSWARGATATVNKKPVGGTLENGKYLRIERTWKAGDKVELTLPKELTLRRWEVNKNSVSVDYGPLTLSLKIGQEERTVPAPGRYAWIDGTNPDEWPSTEIWPTTSWNYSLVLSKGDDPLKGFTVRTKDWPSDNWPFTIDSVPLEVTATGRRVPSWTLDETGLCNVLPEECAPRAEVEPITLVPMGAAMIRISAFPNTTE